MEAETTNAIHAHELKYYRDLKNVTDTAEQKGREEGISLGVELGKQQAVLALQQNGFDAAFIAKNLNLSLDAVTAMLISLNDK